MLCPHSGKVNKALAFSDPQSAAWVSAALSHALKPIFSTDKGKNAYRDLLPDLKIGLYCQLHLSITWGSFRYNGRQHLNLGKGNTFYENPTFLLCAYGIQPHM